MAKKRETIASAGLLTDLQKVGYFRKISDRVQVGIPDIIGTYRGQFYGLEIKALNAVPEDGLMPTKGSHPFDSVQIQNLKEIDNNGGVGLGLVIIGPYAFYARHWQINPEGQVNAKTLSQLSQCLKKFAGKWNVKSFLEETRRT